MDYVSKALSFEQCLFNKRLLKSLKRFNYLWTLLRGVILWSIRIERNDIALNNSKQHDAKLEKWFENDFWIMADLSGSLCYNI
jgi:hypothetical protein